MTMFEELCKSLGVPHGTVAEQLVSEMVNEMIFDESREYTDEEIISTVSERFREAEKAVSKAMSRKPRPKYFTNKCWRKAIAKIGRYGTYPSYCKVTSPLYGRLFIDIQTPFGSDNAGIPESFKTYEAAQEYLERIGFTPVY